MSEYFVSVRIEFKNSIQQSIFDQVKKTVFLFSCIIYTFSIAVNAQEKIPIKSTILNESKLSILGTSNVTDFECLYEDNFQIDTLSHSLTLDDRMVRAFGDTLNLKIENFDCGRKGINKDFRNTLRSDLFPSIDISLLSFVPSDSLLEEVNVLISLAGADKKYALAINATYQDNGVIQIIGKQELTMTDFNLEPPKALFGLVKVRDELTIVFTLYLKTL